MEPKNECTMPECTQKTDIQKIGQDVQDIKIALLGNEYNNNEGFIARVTKLESQVKQIRGKLIYISGISAGGGMFIGFVMEKLFKL